MRATIVKLAVPFISLWLWLPAYGQEFAPEDLAKVREHAPWGAPSGNPWHGTMQYVARQGYVLAFDKEHGGRVPTWVAFKVAPDFLTKKVSRKGRFKSYRVDPEISEAPRDKEYDGYFKTRGFARGHLAPWAVMGGDRNGDGQYADEDEDDAQTLMQSNYMANLAPQHHAAFNGSAGVWYKCEKFIQDELVRNRGLTVYVIAGCIFGIGEHEVIGPNEDIWVPAMFFQIVAIPASDENDAPQLLAFLFPHHRKAHGTIEHFLVPVDLVESMTGLDFFHELDGEVEEQLEDQDTWETWEHLQAPTYVPPTRRQRDVVED